MAVWVATHLRRRPGAMSKLLGIATGLMLVRKATTGRSSLYRALGVSSAGLRQGSGINIDTSVTVKRPRAELYEFWRDLSNLPLVMRHVESVETLSGGITHWRVSGPAGVHVEWDSSIINETPFEYIAWKSLPGSQVEHSGSVHFNDAGDKGTEVLVRLRYVPPGMAPGFVLAKALNRVTEAEVAEDLRRFKHTMETGIDITTEGQPVGPELVMSR
jgi:uncharacterized membrane protein